MKFNRRDLLKRLAIIPLVGLLVKKAAPPTYGGGVIYGYTNFPVRVPEASVFDLKGLPLPIVHSDFILSLRTWTMFDREAYDERLRQCALARGISVEEYEQYLKIERIKRAVDIAASREEFDDEE